MSIIRVSCPKTNAFAPSAVRHSPPVIPRIPNRSTSRCDRIADASGAAVTSGCAHARTVPEPSRLRFPGMATGGGVAERTGRTVSRALMRHLLDVWSLRQLLGDDMGQCAENLFSLSAKVTHSR